MNFAPEVDESRKEAVSENDDVWDFGSTVQLDEVECAGVKSRFRRLHDSCRVMCRKVSSIVTEAVEVG